MTDFGFTLSRSATVDLDRVDRSRYERLVALSPDARICMNCGSCGATCTAAPFSGMSLRKVLLGLQRGCTMVCPRGINTRRLILSLSKVYD